jgi:uncharacterized protein (TIGR03067 family)
MGSTLVRDIFTASAVAGLLVAATAAAAGEKSDQEKLQGTWECVETHMDGKRVDMYLGVRAKIDGNHLTWLFPKDGKFTETKATFTIDPTKDPKQFDWTPDGTKEVHQRLYELDGDVLKWSTNLGPDAPRPAKFSEGKWQFTMKRLK